MNRMTIPRQILVMSGIMRRCMRHRFGDDLLMDHRHSHREETALHRTGIPIAALDISPNKTHAILAGREILKTVRVNDGRVSEDFNLRSAITSYASTRTTTGQDFQPATDVKWSHSEHDTKIATASSSGRVILYDLTKPGVELARLHEHDRQVHRLAFNPFSATKLLSGSQDGTDRLWDLRLLDRERGAVTMPSQHVFYGRSEAVRDVRWSTSDGFEFAMGTDSGSIQLWDFRFPNTPKLRINAHEKPCTALDWHPDGKHLASGGLDKDVKIWDFSSADRRQKPLFVLRTPQSIMRLRWRPACWSSEVQEAGDWQCTQLVTCYNQDDPRIHIWDLQRPHIPFREIDRSRGAPSDLLWHSKDLLWTVGNEGNFVQTDTKYAPQIVDQLSLCHINFTPDGGFVKISERRLSRGLHEASESFLNQKREPSRSWTDDDVAQETFPIRRRQSGKAAKYPKSQGNTPPSRDERPVIPLERSLKKGGLFNNRQIGLVQEITGASLNGPAFEFLAQNYAQPMSEVERRMEPDQILSRLEQAFKRNADLCGEISMYRLAQTWRILGAVILPELASWVASNRQERLTNKQIQATIASPIRTAEVTNHTSNALDDNSTSNVATPLVKPMTDLVDRGPSGLRYTEIDEEVTPLPDSILASHNTAAAAAKTLIPEKEHPSSPARIANQDISPKSTAQDKALSAPQVIPRTSNWLGSPVLDKRREEEKRAALRDYRVQSRPLLRLEDSGSSRPVGPDRHDSTESFSMFSSSTGSSLKVKSVGHSLDLHSPQVPTSGQSDPWKHVPLDPHDGIDPTFPQRAKLDGRQDSSDFDGSGDFPDHVQVDPHGNSGSSDLSRQMHGGGDDTSLGDHFGKSTEDSLPFDFEPTFPLSVRNHPGFIGNRDLDPRNGGDKLPKVDVLSPDLIFPDFRPIDVAIDDPGQDRPGWDSYSLIAAAIEFDLTASHDNSTCQFTTHLLMHISPFFKPLAMGMEINAADPSLPRSIQSRLKSGSMARRIAESSLSTYLQCLNSRELYTQVAEVRKFAHSNGYPNVSRPIGLNDGPSMSQELQLFVTCGHCGTPLGGRNVGPQCLECQKPREPCPICLSFEVDSGNEMWTQCIGCGHGGHVSCHSEWLLDPESNGACPTPGCWHDCGPGQVRQDRIESQNRGWIKENLTKGKTVKDSWVVNQSPAVGRTRKVLREPSFAGSGRKQVRLLAPGETSGGITLSSSH